jgi:hypothetical protein
MHTKPAKKIAIAAGQFREDVNQIALLAFRQRRAQSFHGIRLSYNLLYAAL